MEKMEIDRLIDNLQKNKEYNKANEILEKVIITHYASLLNEKTKFIFHGKLRMLEEVEKYLEIEEQVNFRTFYEVTNDTNLSDENLFNELETIYYKMNIK